MSETLKTKKRDSNLELFRIITMIMIVAHHYVVNSGLMNEIMQSNISLKNVYLLLFGAWGKIGINCFVFITGYFMCKSNITVRKFVKLVGEILFYVIIIGAIFVFTGYTDFSILHIVSLFIPVRNVSDVFTSAYLIFFLFIPFLNVLLRNINERKHIKLMILCVFLYVFLASVPFFSVTMNYVSWFIVLYLLSSYIRLYPKKIFNQKNVWIILSIFFVCIASCSVIGGYIFLGAPYHFVVDSNKLLAVLTSLSLFLMFKNINLKYNRFINTVAASTFGVLLIHANCDEMRQWLWRDVCNNVGMYNSEWIFVHSVGCVLIIYIACTLIDYFRIHFIEKPFLKLFDEFYPKLTCKYFKFSNKICKVLHID